LFREYPIDEWWIITLYIDDLIWRWKMPSGTIRRLMDRGYGFIMIEQGEDLFFHRSQIKDVDFNSLREGQEVEFEFGKGRDGRPQAMEVRLAATGSGQSEPETTALEDVGPTPSEPEAEENTQKAQD